MNMKSGFCPHCHIPFEYWTTEDNITHATCGFRISVEPCDPEPVEEITEPEVDPDGTDI